jgi:hypothetical protein
MLRRRVPELLLCLGVVLALGVAAAYLVTRYGHRSAERQSTSGVTAPSIPAATAPAGTTTAALPATSLPRAEPELPRGLFVSALSPFAATVAWHTAVPTIGSVSFGPRAIGETRSLGPTTLGTGHSVTLTSLAFATDYSVRVTSIAVTGARATATLDLTTPALASLPAASVQGGRVLLDGQPWFPLLEYGECSTLYDSSVATGITLFAGNPCGGLPAQLDALHGRALSAGVASAQGDSGAGTIGTFYPDEADGHGFTGALLPTVPPGLRFLTLTSHFYSGADPLPGGRSTYPTLISRADVVGFDLYPLQGWCQRDRLVDVFAAQRELVAMAKGRPTFQWIEAAGMNCPTAAADQVSPATVRAEAWLAIAGGAHGLGFFPAAWTGDVGGAISRVAAEIAGLEPAILRTPLAGVAANPGIRAAAWSVGDSLYIVAINPETNAMRATVDVPGLAGKRLDVLEEGRQITPSGESLTDTFAPLEVHLYVTRTSSP